MVIGERKAKEVLEALDRFYVNSDRSRMGIEEMYNFIRRFGIIEKYQIKDIILYLEAMERIRLDGTNFTLIGKKKVNKGKD